MSISFGTWDITGGISDGGGDVHNKGYYSTSSALIAAQSTAQPGDYAIVGETSTVWVWDESAGTWVDTDTKGEVSSVNGKTGTVILTASDVGAVYTGGKNVLVNNNIISADQYPLFTVNSGNLNAQGEGDLVGEIDYERTANSYYSASGNVTTSYMPSGSNVVGTTSIAIPASTDTFNVDVCFPQGLQNGNQCMQIGFVGNKNQAPSIQWLGTPFIDIYRGALQISDGRNTSSQINFPYRNNKFYFRLEFANNELKLKYSVDKESWDVLITHSPVDRSRWSENTPNGWLCANRVYASEGIYFNLEDYKFYKNNGLVWAAIDAIYLAQSLSFKVGGSYPSIQATSGQGEQFTIEELADQTLSGYADGTYNVFLTPEGTTYANTGVVYVQNATPTMSADDVWFNTSVYPYKVVQSDGVTEFTDIPICKLTIETQANGSVLVKDSETYPYNRSALFPMFTSAAAEFMTLEQNG